MPQAGKGYNRSVRRFCHLAVYATLLAGLAGCLKEYVYDHLPGEVVGELATPAGLPNLSASTCGACHTEIYAEWSASAMGQGWVDPVFQADFVREHSAYVCLNCHTPLQQQRPEIIHGLVSLKPIVGAGVTNPTYDPKLRDEGVTCAACHVRDGQVLGSIAAVTAPHSHTVDPEFGNADLCASCHQVQGPPFSSLRRPIADVVGEWSQWQAATGRTETCKDCHMPEVVRQLTAHTPPRRSGSHRFPGAWDDTFVRSAIRIDAVARTATAITVTITNLSGHRFPTDDPLRAALVTAALAISDSQSVSRTVVLGRTIDPKSYAEYGDTTLAPAETRVVELSFGAELLAQARSATVEIAWSPLHGAAPEVRAVRPRQAILYEQPVP